MATDDLDLLPINELNQYITDLTAATKQMQNEWRIVGGQLRNAIKHAHLELARRTKMNFLQTVQDCIDKQLDWYLHYYDIIELTWVDPHTERVVLQRADEYVEVTFTIDSDTFDHVARRVHPTTKEVTVYE